MNDKKITYWDYLKKGSIWFFGNFVFGILPVLFMLVVFVISKHKLGFGEMENQIHEGVIMFVCTAMMGAVLVDVFQCPHRFKGVEIFALFLTPFVLVGMICIEYLFVVLKIINSDCFDITSIPSNFVLLSTFLYCVFIKANLLIKEDVYHE